MKTRVANMPYNRRKRIRPLPFLSFFRLGGIVLESKFQSQLIEDLRNLFPGCHILKNDTDYQQGIPDLLVLFEDRWAMLEAKRKMPTSPNDFEPNQEYFIDVFNQMSFAACIYPENKEEVLHALQQTFFARRKARVSQR